MILVSFLAHHEMIPVPEGLFVNNPHNSSTDSTLTRSRSTRDYISPSLNSITGVIFIGLEILYLDFSNHSGNSIGLQLLL